MGRKKRAAPGSEGGDVAEQRESERVGAASGAEPESVTGSAEREAPGNGEAHGSGGEERKRKRGKHDKPKPWDTDDIDHWKVEKFDPAWNPSGMLEESSFATLFPQYRGEQPTPAPLLLYSLNAGVSNLRLPCHAPTATTSSSTSQAVVPDPISSRRTFMSTPLPHASYLCAPIVVPRPKP